MGRASGDLPARLIAAREQVRRARHYRTRRGRL